MEQAALVGMRAMILLNSFQVLSGVSNPHLEIPMYTHETFLFEFVGTSYVKKKIMILLFQVCFALAFTYQGNA